MNSVDTKHRHNFLVFSDVGEDARKQYNNCALLVNVLSLVLYLPVCFLDICKMAMILLARVGGMLGTLASKPARAWMIRGTIPASIAVLPTRGMGVLRPSRPRNDELCCP
jgi:hypothetical protein